MIKKIKVGGVLYEFDKMSVEELNVLEEMLLLRREKVLKKIANIEKELAFIEEV